MSVAFKCDVCGKYFDGYARATGDKSRVSWKFVDYSDVAITEINFIMRNGSNDLSWCKPCCYKISHKYLDMAITQESDETRGK